MTVLSDVEIRERLSTGNIIIDPLDDDSQIQPASVDLRLGSKVSYYLKPTAIDEEVVPWEDNSHLFVEDTLSGDNLILSGEFVLAEILENIEIGNDLAARLEGKSSLGRLGLLVHSTAGYVDPGWKGKLTLELTNVSPRAIVLREGMKICQISFLMLGVPAERVYGSKGLNSKYKGKGLELSKYYEDK